MAKANSYDGAGAALLKECYELAARYEERVQEREILKKKASQLEVSTDGGRNSVVRMRTEVEGLYKLMCDISNDLETRNISTFFLSEMGKIPNSADKEYLLALFYLRGVIDRNSRLEALRHISVAIEYDSNDPRYIALAKLLQELE